MELICFSQRMLSSFIRPNENIGKSGFLDSGVPSWNMETARCMRRLVVLTAGRMEDSVLDRRDDDDDDDDDACTDDDRCLPLPFGVAVILLIWVALGMAMTDE